MKKCDTFEDLQELGTEKIHERTHISRDKVELILTKSYGQIGKVQFMGFISILEREYGIDLSEIRYEYSLSRNDQEGLLPPKDTVILQPSTDTKRKWILAGAVLIGVLIVGGYLLQTLLSNEPKEEVMQLNTPPIEAVDATAEANLTVPMEANITEPAEANSTEAAAVEEAATPKGASEAILVENGLQIRPMYKVWVGMIDTATGEKTQTITRDPIVIDTAKNWLIVMGHGRVEIDSSAGKKLLKEKETVWFVYENKALTQLSKEEFVQRNGGKNW